MTSVEEKSINILFVCVGNTCRSQMAEGFARAYSDGKIKVRSAGTAAYGELVRPTIEVMKEKGIDISEHTSDQLTPDLFEWADVVVSMADYTADRLCPNSCHSRKIDWKIHDPFGGSIDAYRISRDEIEYRVKLLLDEIRDGEEIL